MLDNFPEVLKKEMKVLVVDDVVYMRAIVIDMLKRLGITDVTEADDGEKAHNLIQNSPFSLVLCDWHMPKVNGISLLRMIRFSHDTKTLPFIMVTSNQKLDDVKECIATGVSGFLLKPFELEKMEKQLVDLFDDVVLHHQTLGLLNEKIIEALEQQPSQ